MKPMINDRPMRIFLALPERVAASAVNVILSPATVAPGQHTRTHTPTAKCVDSFIQTGQRCHSFVVTVGALQHVTKKPHPNPVIVADSTSVPFAKLGTKGVI